MLTDLDALAATDELRRTVGALRKARHRVSVVALAGARFIGAAPAGLTKEQAIARAEHEAEEKGTKCDASKITGPQTVYQIMGVGAVVE